MTTSSAMANRLIFFGMWAPSWAFQVFHKASTTVILNRRNESPHCPTLVVIWNVSLCFLPTFTLHLHLFTRIFAYRKTSNKTLRRGSYRKWLNVKCTLAVEDSNKKSVSAKHCVKLRVCTCVAKWSQFVRVKRRVKNKTLVLHKLYAIPTVRSKQITVGTWPTHDNTSFHLLIRPSAGDTRFGS